MQHVLLTGRRHTEVRLTANLRITAEYIKSTKVLYIITKIKQLSIIAKKLKLSLDIAVTSQKVSAVGSIFQNLRQFTIMINFSNLFGIGSFDS